MTRKAVQSCSAVIAVVVAAPWDLLAPFPSVMNIGQVVTQPPLLVLLMFVSTLLLLLLLNPSAQAMAKLPGSDEPPSTDW